MTRIMPTAVFCSIRAAETDVMDRIGAMPDVFRRSLLWGSLWDSVRQADLAPRDYVALATKLLPAERDESLAQSLLAHAGTALHRYVSDDARQELVPAFETVAANQMTQSPDAGPSHRLVPRLRAAGGNACGPGQT